MASSNATDQTEPPAGWGGAGDTSAGYAPNARTREVATKIADLIDREGITGHQARINVMLCAAMNVLGAWGYQQLLWFLKGDRSQAERPR